MRLGLVAQNCESFYFSINFLVAQASGYVVIARSERVSTCEGLPVQFSMFSVELFLANICGESFVTTIWDRYR